MSTEKANNLIGCLESDIYEMSNMGRQMLKTLFETNGTEILNEVYKKFEQEIRNNNPKYKSPDLFSSIPEVWKELQNWKSAYNLSH